MNDRSQAASAGGGSSAEQTPARCFERAEALNGFGRREEAIAELRRGLGVFPDDPELLGYLGWLLFFAGEQDEAEDFALRTLAVRPADARALNTLCEITVAQARFAEGAGYARELLRHFPDWPVSHLHLAYALASDASMPFKARRRRRTEARASIDRALELAPEDVETLRRSTVLLRRLGDAEAASRTLDRGLELAPDDESLLLLAAQRESEKTSGPQHLQGLGLSAGHQAAALRILSGVLADNPRHRGVARAVSDDVWGRTRLLATIGLWVCVLLMLFAYLVFGEPMSTSRRTQVRAGEALLILPAAWFVLFFTIRTKGLPKRFMRRLYAPVWWVWIGFVVAAIGGLGALLAAFSLALRSGETQLQMQGSYVGGITMMIGFCAWMLLIAELLFVFARFRSEQRSGLFPGDDEGRAAARAELREHRWSLVRVGIAALLACVPLVAAPVAMRPEAAGGFAAVAAALGIPPLIALLLRVGRVVSHRRGGNGGAGAMLWAALAVAVLGVAGVWLLADRHAAEHDPPPMPWEIEMREQQKRMRDSIGDLDIPDPDDLDVPAADPQGSAP